MVFDQGYGVRIPERDDTDRACVRWLSIVLTIRQFVTIDQIAIYLVLDTVLLPSVDPSIFVRVVFLSIFRTRILPVTRSRVVRVVALVSDLSLRHRFVS